MKVQVLRGSKQQIAETVAGISGEVREAVVFVEDPSETGSDTAARTFSPKWSRSRSRRATRTIRVTFSTQGWRENDPSGHQRAGPHDRLGRPTLPRRLAEPFTPCWRRRSGDRRAAESVRVLGCGHSIGQSGRTERPGHDTRASQPMATTLASAASSALPDREELFTYWHRLAAYTELRAFGRMTVRLVAAMQTFGITRPHFNLQTSKIRDHLLDPRLCDGCAGDLASFAVRDVRVC